MQGVLIVPLRRRVSIHLSLLVPVLMLVTAAQASVKFQPVSPQELKMTSEPQVPGAPAIILYREVYRDDCGIACRSTSAGVMSEDRFEEDYFRIKILTEAGTKYGQVEIPLWNEEGTVGGISARTIRPDGSIVDFKGQIFEKTIIKAKGLKYVAKTFAMPDVQVGSIIEYYYTKNFFKGRIFFSNWILSHELFTKQAKFSLRPFEYGSLRWNEHLPSGVPSPKKGPDGTVRLEVANIAAFEPEDFMPPVNEFKARVDFIYSREFEADANKFWKKEGKERYSAVEKFVGRRGAMEQAVSQIVSPADPPEVKLHKIYARVQQFHNTTYEVQKTEEEKQREKSVSNESVEDVWKHGSGRGWELTWLYLALVRAAGFEAYGVVVADRRNFLFNPQSMQSDKLDSNLVLVRLNGKDLYFDPGAAFTLYGMLRWDETGVPGLRLDKDGGSWVQTSLPDSSASQIQRKADFKLFPTGDMEGHLVVTFTGFEAQSRRVDQRNEDDTARKKSLEDEVQGYIPIGSDVGLTKQPDWTSSDSPLVAEFTVKIPGWASISPRHVLFPVGIFGGSEKHVFDHTTRTYPIYFEYLAQKLDDITIEIPPGWQVTGLPKPQNQDLHVVGYACSAEDNKGTLHLTRKVDINILSMETKYYTPIQNFFQIIRTGDDQQIALQPGTAVSSN